MDQLDIVDELEMDVRQERSTFLTVLCILTWVGSGMLMLYHAYMYLMLANAANILSRFGDSKSLNWIIIEHMVGMIAPLFSIIGAVVMWRLKKIGFVIYALGQVAPIVAIVFSSLYLARLTDSSEVFFMIALPSVIPLGFLVMYATRLQEMKK